MRKLALLLSLLIAIPPAAFAKQDDVADAQELTEITQSYRLTTENGASEGLDVTVSGIQVNSPSEAKAALKWFWRRQVEAKGQGDASIQKFALVAAGADADVPAVDLSEFEKIELPADGFAELAAGASDQSLTSRLKTLSRFLISQKYSLAVIRAVGVGGSVYTGFVYSKLPLVESLVASATIGLISGAIQLNVKGYTELLLRQGWIARSSQSLAARISQVFGLDYEKTKDRLRNSMPFNFVFNQSAKLTLMTAAIYSLVNLEFLALGSPLHSTLWSAVTSVTVATLYSVFGQGAIDSAIATHQGELKKNILEDPDSLKRLEIKTAVKILSIALVANFAAVLVTTDNMETVYVGKQILNGITLGGLTYWSYLLFTYDQTVRAKLKSLRAYCGSLLTRAHPI